MIKFLDINIEGFGNILGPFVYKLESPGLNLINGPNGSGKTTIFSAFTWCIWGSSLKSKAVTPWEIIQPKEFKGTKVTVSIKIGLEDITITRCQNYKGKVEGSKGANRILLYINGKYQESLRNKDDVQVKIIDLLGISFNLAKNSLVFGQKLTRLLTEKGEAQKKLFDEAFEATFINHARSKATQDMEAFIRDLKGLQDEYSKLWSEYKHNKSQIKNIKKVYKEQQQYILDDLKASITRINKRIKDAINDKPNYLNMLAHETKVKDEIRKLQTRTKSYNNLKNRRFKIEFKLGQEEAEQTNIILKLRAILTSLSSAQPKCPTCGQELNKEQKLKVRIDLRAKEQELRAQRILQEGIIKHDKEKLATVDSSLLSYKDDIDSLKNYENELESLLRDGYDTLDYRPYMIPGLKREREVLKDKYLAKRNETPDLSKFRVARDKAKIKCLSLKKPIKVIKKSLDLYKWLINDPLSNAGLKAYIFNTMLGNVNKALTGYNNVTGFKVTLTMDLESGRKNFEALIYKDDYIIGYDELSGGQQQLVDVCTAFAIHDVLAADNRFNILIMDEVFESLDANNIDVVMDLLQVKARKNSIHIITHLPKLNSGRLANTLKLESRSKISSIV